MVEDLGGDAEQQAETILARLHTLSQQLNAAAGEIYFAAAKSKNPQGGKEYLRTMLSKKAALEFTKLTKSLTVVAGAAANAIFDATGLHLRQVPFTPERVKAAMAPRA